MDLNSLVSLKTFRFRKRLGRGYGSGKGGHTVGRGSKGNKARGKVPLLFAGTKFKKSWLQRLPLWRGKGSGGRYFSVVEVNLDVLDRLFKDGEKVNSKLLMERLGVKEGRFKILGRGKITKPLLVFVPCSRGAADKIKKAGGKVIMQKD
jgi:large subunit ribosomal protein L15